MDIDSAMEWEADHAYSECGECAEDYLSCIKKEHLVELENDINSIFEKWLIKHGHWPRFGIIEESKEFDNRLFTQKDADE